MSVGRGNYGLRQTIEGQSTIHLFVEIEFVRLMGTLETLKDL